MACSWSFKNVFLLCHAGVRTGAESQHACELGVAKVTFTPGLRRTETERRAIAGHLLIPNLWVPGSVRDYDSKNKKVREDWPLTSTSEHRQTHRQDRWTDRQPCTHICRKTGTHTETDRYTTNRHTYTCRETGTHVDA